MRYLIHQFSCLHHDQFGLQTPEALPNDPDLYCPTYDGIRNKQLVPRIAPKKVHRSVALKDLA